MASLTQDSDSPQRGKMFGRAGGGAAGIQYFKRPATEDGELKK